MPFLEILAPPLSAVPRAAAAAALTEGICAAFGVGAETVTLFFLDVPPTHYTHAGRPGPGDAPQRILVKLHAYRRDAAARRRACGLTVPLAAAYGVPTEAIALYFLEREKDEVAHGGRLSSDAAAA